MIRYLKKNKMKVIIIIIILLIYFNRIIVDEMKIKNYNEFKYNYKEYDNFITEKERIYFLKNIEKNKFIEDNPLNDYFKNTKGLLIEFSRSNDYEEFKVNELNFLYNYYKKIRKPYATDFILNILIIDAINEKDNNIFKKNSVKYHHDTTLNLVDNSEFIKKDIVPECVSVLYIDLPKNFKKGNLRLYKFFKWYYIGKIKPEKRKLVEFNGKILHGVEKIIDTDNNSGRRISIVLEQYIKKI